MVKIYSGLLLNRIEPELWEIFRMNQNNFRRNRYTTPDNPSNFSRSLLKKLQATLLFVEFSKAFDSILREMEQIFRAYGLSKETITGVMMLYKNTKLKVHTSDEDTDFSDIVASVLQGD